MVEWLHTPNLEHCAEHEHQPNLPPGGPFEALPCRMFRLRLTNSMPAAFMDLLRNLHSGNELKKWKMLVSMTVQFITPVQQLHGLLVVEVGVTLASPHQGNYHGMQKTGISQSYEFFFKIRILTHDGRAMLTSAASSLSVGVTLQPLR